MTYNRRDNQSYWTNKYTIVSTLIFWIRYLCKIVDGTSSVIHTLDICTGIIFFIFCFIFFIYFLAFYYTHTGSACTSTSTAPCDFISTRARNVGSRARNFKRFSATRRLRKFVFCTLLLDPLW